MNQEVMSMKQLARLRSVIILLACMAPLAASAVGPYDGKWTGQRDVGGNCATVTVQLVVKNNRLSGAVRSSMEISTIINARVGAEGKLRFSTSNRPARFGTVSFSSTGFEMNIHNACGDIVISGGRAI
jgi:hypothetical protein